MVPETASRWVKSCSALLRGLTSAPKWVPPSALRSVALWAVQSGAQWGAVLGTSMAPPWGQKRAHCWVSLWAPTRVPGSGVRRAPRWAPLKALCTAARTSLDRRYSERPCIPGGCTWHRKCHGRCSALAVCQQQCCMRRAHILCRSPSNSDSLRKSCHPPVDGHSHGCGRGCPWC